jgi:hypothetical protein
MLLPRLSLLLLLAAWPAGCASDAKKHQFDEKTANSRALEQRRMRLVTEYSDQGVTARGAEIAIIDRTKEFNPRSAKFGNDSTYLGTKTAHSNTFNFVDRVRTRDFNTKEYGAKTAWMGDVQFETKAAPVRQSWFGRKTAQTKSFETRNAAMGDKTAATRALPGGDKPFLVKGRKQALFDTHGPAAQAMGGDRMGGQSWSGELKQLSIDDVKKLLNKN